MLAPILQILQGKMDAAASMIEKAIIANPTYAEAYNNLGASWILCPSLLSYIVLFFFNYYVAWISDNLLVQIAVFSSNEYALLVLSDLSELS